jgi:hypothetical protein
MAIRVAGVASRRDDTAPALAVPPASDGGSLPSQACCGGSQHQLRHALALDETYRLDAQP